jgi:hypothetical protein
VNSVSIVPSGDGYSFKPMQEYIIGNIGASEMYTAQITVTSNNASNTADPQFKVVYKNGNNWHESTLATVYTDDNAVPQSTNTGNSTLMIVLGVIVLAIVAVGGVFVYTNGKRAKK